MKDNLRQDLQDLHDIFLPFRKKGKKHHHSWREMTWEVGIISSRVSGIELSRFHPGREKNKDPINHVNPVEKN
jgi:hypothetical protein